MLGMLFETIILALLVGHLRKGKLSNLENVPMRGWMLISLGFVIYLFQIAVLRLTQGSLAQMVFNNLEWFQLSSNLIIIAGLLVSSMEMGYIISALGISMNTLAAFVNGGRMPVSKEALEGLGLFNQLSVLQAGGTSVHQLADELTSLYLLCDVIPVPFITPKAVSLGDILLGLGIFLIIHKYMISPKALHS